VKTWAIPVAILIVIAAYLRIPDLSDRPMHADEAVYAYKFQTLLQTGNWSYEPGEYHGPVLHYLTVLPVRLGGLTETTLRIGPALLGILLVLAPLLLANELGKNEALAAAALVAVSPAMVYYSRYYIPEMLLALLTATMLVAAYRYTRERKLVWALGAGLIVGLMFATKETAIIAAAAALIATRQLPDWRHVLSGLGIACVVILLLLGPRETLESISVYIDRAVHGDRHIHPWYYYLQIALRREAVIVILAIVGAVASKEHIVRFVAIYTLSMIVIYSLIPYKTPWCLLGFLYGLIVLAGVGLMRIARTKAVAVALMAVCGVYLFHQAFVTSRQYSANPNNPYAYAHTSRDVYAIRDQMEKFRNLPVQVISAQNVWPLPWYLRSFPQVAWRRAVTDDMRPAPVILISAEMEPALLHLLYEVLPPGQRPLYVNLFPKYAELRPGLELRCYVQQSVLAATE